MVLQDSVPGVVAEQDDVYACLGALSGVEGGVVDQEAGADVEAHLGLRTNLSSRAVVVPEVDRCKNVGKVSVHPCLRGGLDTEAPGGNDVEREVSLEQQEVLSGTLDGSDIVKVTALEEQTHLGLAVLGRAAPDFVELVAEEVSGLKGRSVAVVVEGDEGGEKAGEHLVDVDGEHRLPLGHGREMSGRESNAQMRGRRCSGYRLDSNGLWMSPRRGPVTAGTPLTISYPQQ